MWIPLAADNFSNGWPKSKRRLSSLPVKLTICAEVDAVGARGSNGSPGQAGEVFNHLAADWQIPQLQLLLSKNGLHLADGQNDAELKEVFMSTIELELLIRTVLLAWTLKTTLR